MLLLASFRLVKTIGCEKIVLQEGGSPYARHGGDYPYYHGQITNEATLYTLTSY